MGTVIRVVLVIFSSLLAQAHSADLEERKVVTERLSVYREVLTKNPNNLEVRAEFIETLINEMRLKPAEEELDTFRRLHAKHPVLAQIEECLGQATRYQKQLSSTSESDPLPGPQPLCFLKIKRGPAITDSRPIAYEELASVAVSRALKKRWHERLTRALQQGEVYLPSASEIKRLGAAEKIWAMGERDLALKTFKTIATDYPKSPRPWLNVFENYVKEQSYRQAFAIAREKLSSRFNQPEVKMVWAEILSLPDNRLDPMYLDRIAQLSTEFYGEICAHVASRSNDELNARVQEMNKEVDGLLAWTENYSKTIAPMPSRKMNTKK